MIRALALAVIMSIAPALATETTAPPSASGEARQLTISALMQVSALDLAFVSFGEAIASSADQYSASLPEAYVAAWKETARGTFEPKQMQQALLRSMEGKLTPEQIDELSDFYQSDIGKHIVSLEIDLQWLSVDAQRMAYEQGKALLDGLPPDARRAQQIDGLMQLPGSQIGRSMFAEAMRAMMLGMQLAARPGDIEVPWDEIDAQLAQIMPSVELEVLAAQRGLSAYAYQSLSDDDLAVYLAFLQTDSAQYYYASVSTAIGEVVSEAMRRFGTKLVGKLKQVNV